MRGVEVLVIVDVQKVAAKYTRGYYYLYTIRYYYYGILEQYKQ